MKWFASQCRCHREKIALLASGAASKEDRVETEKHLAACEDCQKYFVELKALATALAGWENHFAHIESTVAVRVILANHSAASPQRSPSLTIKPFLLECYRRIVLPSRGLWAGLAAVWLVVLVANHHLNSDAPKMSASTSARAADFMLTLREQEKMMAELTFQPEPAAVEPSRKFVPRPRSEAREKFFLT